MRNVNLPKTRVYVRKDAFGGNPEEFQAAWLLSARALRNRPLCFQVWVDEFAACFDKIPPHCLYWQEPDTSHSALPLHKVQMWECLTGNIELWQKALLVDTPVLVNLGRGCHPGKGRYWFTLDFIPEQQHLGMIDIGDADLLEEHKEANVLKLENGQIAIYPNNRIKWIPRSLTLEGSVGKIPQWDVATNEQWEKWWGNVSEILGDAKWAY